MYKRIIRCIARETEEVIDKVSSARIEEAATQSGAMKGLYEIVTDASDERKGEYDIALILQSPKENGDFRKDGYHPDIRIQFINSQGETFFARVEIALDIDEAVQSGLWLLAALKDSHESNLAAVLEIISEFYEPYTEERMAELMNEA